MNKEKIIECLLKDGLSDIEDLNCEEALALRFFYDFDEEEVKAAKAYANDECGDEVEGDKWYYEYFLPYLSDLAVDNVGETIENVMGELNIDAQYMTYELDKENHSYGEFVAVFYEKGKDIELDTILDKLEQ